MNVSMLVSVGDRCGIADYSRALRDGMAGLVDVTVVPVWDQVEPWDSYLTRSARQLNDADLVHIQHEYSFWGSVLPGQNKFFKQVRTIHRPIVMTAHTLDPAEKVLGLDLPGTPVRRVAKRILASVPAYRRQIEQETFEVAKIIIIHDIGAAAKLKLRGIDESKIRVIPMGVPAIHAEGASGAEFREQFGLAGKRLVVVFGFVRPGRGYEAAMDALSELGPDTALVIAGGPQTEAQTVYLNELLSMIESRGMKDRVIVTGYLKDEMVAGAMRAADVVLCSQEAGTGSYSVQVALAYGRPILASDLPCFTYPEREHGCVLTYERANPADLNAKLKLMLEDEDVRERLSARALTCATDHTWARIAERTVEVYREVLSSC